MSDPSQPPSVSFAFRCPLPLYRRMEQHAATLHLNTSEFIIAALQHALGSPEELDQALAELEQSSID